MAAQIPPVATWRGITTSCGTCGYAHLSMAFEAGVSPIFEGRDGPVLRLRLSPATIKDLVEVLAEVKDVIHEAGRGLCPLCAAQSSNSSGNPHLDGSSREAGQHE